MRCYGIGLLSGHNNSYKPAFSFSHKGSNQLIQNTVYMGFEYASATKNGTFNQTTYLTEGETQHSQHMQCPCKIFLSRTGAYWVLTKSGERPKHNTR